MMRSSASCAAAPAKNRTSPDANLPLAPSAVSADASSRRLSQLLAKSVTVSALAAPNSAKTKLSCPPLPVSVSLPVPPASESLPLPPLRLSLPPRPCMSSALVLPTRVLLALSPTYTAMAGSLLDHGDVGRRDAGTGLHSGDELRAACAVAVRVVIQLPG